MKKYMYFLLLFLLFPLTSFANSDTQIAEEGQKVDLPGLIRQCEGCHGPNGHSALDDVPTIAGNPVAATREAMAQFYFYERHCPTMTPGSADGSEASSTSMCNIASTLNDAEIAALAEYFSGQ